MQEFELPATQVRSATAVEFDHSAGHQVVRKGRSYALGGPVSLTISEICMEVNGESHVAVEAASLGLINGE